MITGHGTDALKHPPRLRGSIVVPEINPRTTLSSSTSCLTSFKTSILGHDKEDPHAHIRYFNKITSTMKFPNVPSTSVKLIPFPYFPSRFSPDMASEKEPPPRPIQTWDDLVSKFITNFSLPSKTTNLSEMKSQISNNDYDETFYEHVGPN
ncbi:hypothetical protein Tco_1203307 [Tanacetum coccineum]